jgi:formylglycine-generating enzyme required for sulfatase activity
MHRNHESLFREGIELFNRRKFFECHEVLEEIWMPSVEPERRFLQSLIHFAVGFYHHRRGNPVGATRQLNKGLRKISGYLPEWGGLRTAGIEQEVRRCLAIIDAGGKIDDFPVIEQYAPYQPASFSESSAVVWLTGGEFRMGQDDGRDEEQPAHRVRVLPFGLGKTQVTNAQYDRFCSATGHQPPKFRRRAEFKDPNQPVVGPSWFDAVAYCEWLSMVTGNFFRLPTEAEWEWAARGGLEGCLYPWGDAPVTERENYHTRWRTGPEPVATSEPNAYGLFDMCENVHEWCSDWYSRDYYRISPEDDPKGPPEGVRRASRGGSWRHHIKISRCAARSSIPPGFEYADYGFRVACERAEAVSFSAKTEIPLDDIRVSIPVEDRYGNWI